MADRPNPYVPKGPGDIIRSGDWNELQIRTREEIRSHEHKGGDDGAVIPRAGIEEKAIDGTRIDPAAEVTLKKLNVSTDLKVDGKMMLGNVDDLLASFINLGVKAREDIQKHQHTGGEKGTLIPRAGIEEKAIDGSLIDPAAEVTLKKLNISGDLKVDGKMMLGNVDDLLANVKNLEQVLKDYVDNLLVGSVMAFATKEPPKGWLECNGKAISRIEYARLFKQIGMTFGAGDAETTFNVPDLRGVFVRGLDAGKGVDPDRVLGNLQYDQMQSHKHDDEGHEHKAFPATHNEGGPCVNSGCLETCTTKTPSPIRVQKGYAQLSGPTPSVGQREVRHGTETRPINIALKYCIKF